MNNNNITDTAEEIIDLTDVVSVGNAGDKNDAPSVEDDVLDSLVNDFEKNIGSVADSELSEEKEENDEPLDLAKLDNLINSYNINFDADDENNQGEKQSANEMDAQNDMDVAFVPDGQQPHTMQVNLDSDIAGINEKQADFNPGSSDNDELDTNDIPSFEDIDLPSLEEENEEGQDDIDLLTKDIIDGTDNAKINSNDNINAPAPEDSFSAFLNDEVEQQETKTKQAPAPQKATPQAAAPKAAKQAAAKAQNTVPQMPAPDMEVPVDNIPLKSDMAEDVEEINENAFNDIFNELSLDHETDEEVVPFAQDAPTSTEPIHLKGDVSFIESQGKNEKTSDDIHLVQSAAKVLASGEAYLEKFNGEDDSVGAKIKNLSTRVASLEQRLVGSDSKAQDSALELTYRINGLETKITELQEAVKAELITIKTESAREENKAQENDQESVQAVAGLIDKIQVLETRIATLDDIFSEQKMLNDELAKNLDTLMQNSTVPDNSSQVQELEAKIAALEGELGQAQTKITALEENIEKAASLAAAKVLREEIIPLLG